MRIWDLENEYDKLISFVQRGREKRKKDVRGAVDTIRKEVLSKKDKALVEFSRKWDNWQKKYPLKISEAELNKGASEISGKDMKILQGMIQNVSMYHRNQRGADRIFKKSGVLVREEQVALESALVYVPGGTAAYPSSLVMGVVPARIAGVKNIYVTTPTFLGQVNPYICAAAQLLGVKDVYRLGGAQAIYAFAYGTASIPKVDIIVGPGNAYVEEAKRDVYGQVGIDMLAGPTELIIFCTEEFSPKAIAWDMFSQAEHDQMATAGLFSPSMKHLKEVEELINRTISQNKRRETVQKALRNNGLLVYYKDKQRAADMINRIAPEHMELIGDEQVLKNIFYPGIIYTGRHTTVAMGDYYIGTNHVLPTGGAGRFMGGLSVDRFTKRKVTVKIDESFIRRYGDQAIRLAEIEGLSAHGEAIRVRKEL
ncbi:MAG TPA: histidinol dehydrogenase [Syntrophorhabdaceae bacterium]|nr:histidinol dehydrogenase [Syntrophorhabdaceae bacterium]